VVYVTQNIEILLHYLPILMRIYICVTSMFFLAFGSPWQQLSHAETCGRICAMEQYDMYWLYAHLFGHNINK